VVRKAALVFLAVGVCLSPLRAAEPEPAAMAAIPPYQIILRSRAGEVVPERYKDAATGGGYIEVVQREPDEVRVLMRGAVVAGREQYHGGSAAMHFVLNQDFEIVPTRAGLRPPRLLIVGQVIGTLQSKVKGGGTAEQGPACAAVNMAGVPVVKFCTKPHSVSAGQKLFVNDREGPFERVVVPGAYCLNQTFELSANQPEEHCGHMGAAAGAVYDPDPALASRWSDVLRPFRGVPHRDFGFGVVIRVVEDVPPPGAKVEEVPAQETLPPPRPAERNNKSATQEVRILHQ
jgi:hypothetical protein